MIETGNLVIITVYVSRGWKTTIIGELSNIVTALLRDKRDVIVTGDFNVTTSEMAKTNKDLLNMTLSPSPEDGTRRGSNGKTTTIDFILHSKGMKASTTTTVDQLSTSDHELLKIEVEAAIRPKIK